MTTTKRSRILDTVHETAQDLGKLGFISERRMKNYAVLDLPSSGEACEKLATNCENFSAGTGRLCR